MTQTAPVIDTRSRSATSTASLAGGVLARLATTVTIDAPDAPAVCPRCGGAFNAECQTGQGFIEVQPADAQYGPLVAYCPRYRAALESRRLQAAIRATGLDDPTFAASWSDLDATSAGWRKARTIAQSITRVMTAGANVVLTGRLGTGKTHAAVLICRDAMKAGRTALRIDWGGFCRSVRESYNDREQPQEDAQVMAAATVDLLLIDDIAASDAGRAHSERLLTAILGARYDAKRATLFTANLKKSELESSLGPRAFDRVSSRAIWLPFAGPAYRQCTERGPIETLAHDLGLENDDD